MWRVSLGADSKSGGWVFHTREQAEKWCEQFGNTFDIEHIPDHPSLDERAQAT